ncbi:MAG: TolC family protein [Phycisphaerae bacterium]
MLKAAAVRGAMRRARLLLCSLVLLSPIACETLVRTTDLDVASVIRERQNATLQYSRPVPLSDQRAAIPRAGKTAYDYRPSPISSDVPEEFRTTDGGAGAKTGSAASRPVVSQPASVPTSLASIASQPDSQPTSQRSRMREKTFTLLDSLSYAQRYRREYQTAKEDLYLVTLALTLERHLWTPIYAGELRTVYGNYGEIRNFDQAMRFVADVSATQRLPMGGEFTARAIGTLIRDIKQNITGTESGQVELGLNVPLLRRAGHVAREQLIQLERDLTYAVRDFERFRRTQLVTVAREYFDLLRVKQEVIDASESLKRARTDFERAQALETAGTGTPLDTRRAEQQTLSQENRVAQLGESFRAATDRFKLVIGMPVDEPIGLDDLEDIPAIEEQVGRGTLPLLDRPAAANDEKRSIDVALAARLDLLNRKDQIDDARRGVSVAENALLPDLDWNTTLRVDTNPNEKTTVGLEIDRSTWRSEIILGLPFERMKERNQLRAAMIDVRRAERTQRQLSDEIRADVRRAVNSIRVAEQVLEIQRRNVEVADSRAEFARIQFYDGDIGNRDLVEAESEWTDARNQFNLAKTQRWTALLEFRLATDTLRVDEVDQPALDERAERSSAN